MSNCLCPETDPLKQIKDTHHLQNNDFYTLSKTEIKIIDSKNKNKYIKNRLNEMKQMNKLECYRSLKREYTLAQYLVDIKSPKQRRILTMYRLSDHNLEIEKGRHKEWKPREDRLSRNCDSGEVEDEFHSPVLFTPPWDKISCPKLTAQHMRTRYACVWERYQSS